jgi:hypothetical protein
MNWLNTTSGTVWFDESTGFAEYVPFEDEPEDEQADTSADESDTPR